VIEAAELAELRATSVTAMPDTVTVTRLAWPSAVLDEDTGLYEPDEGDEIYSGAARIRPAGAVADTPVHGDALVTVTRWVATLPHDAGAFAIGDVLVVTDSADPHIATRSFRIVDIPGGSWSIDQRLTCEEVTDRG